MSDLSYKKKFDLHGKTAVVTGGVGILGKHFSAGLAEFGANVVIVDLDETKVKTYARFLSEKYGVYCIGIACDITDRIQVKEMVEQVKQELGEIHILLNNAASKSNNLEAFFAKFEDYSIEEWNKVMQVNIDGMFIIAQAIGKEMMRNRKGGSIIQTSSIYGLLAPDQRIYEGSLYLGRNINTPAVYSTSKAAVIGLTKYLASYWAKDGIRVNTIIPGGNESGQNKQFIQQYAARVPLRRMGKPDEMVGAVLFLASDASSYITGQEIIIDGGLSAW